MGASPTLPTLTNGDQTFRYVPIGDAHGLERLPFSLRIVLENLRRQAVVGSIDQVKAKLDALAKRLDLDELVVVTWTYDLAPRMRSYELLAQAYGLQVV